MLENTKKIKEEIKNLMFATCPTEEKEPFYWKWNDHGLDILEIFIKEKLSQALETRNKELGVEIKGMKLTITPEMMGKKEYEAYNEALETIITLIQSK